MKLRSARHPSRVNSNSSSPPPFVSSVLHRRGKGRKHRHSNLSHSTAKLSNKRGKRRVLRKVGTVTATPVNNKEKETPVSSSSREKNAYLQVEFLPVSLIRHLTDMTCDVQASVDTSCSGYHRCSACPLAFCSEDEYTTHVKTAHATQSPASSNSPPSGGLRCQSCSYTAPDTSQARIHEKLHRDQKKGVVVFTCQSCSFLSCSKVGVTIHRRLEHAPQKYQCPTCQYSSFNARHVTAHVEKVHFSAAQEEDLYNCPYCSNQFHKGLDLRVHIEETHTDESQFKEFTCDLCDYQCHTNTDIFHHMKAHRAKKKLIKCTHCHFISTQFDKYTRHMEKCHPPPSDNEQEGEEDVQVDDTEMEEVDVISRDDDNPPAVLPAPTIPVIRVVQKRDQPSSAEQVGEDMNIDHVMYTPPSSPPTARPDPGNIFERLNLSNQDKTSVCNALGLRESANREDEVESRSEECKQEEFKPKVGKLKSSSSSLNRKSLKRCRYCTTKTMFDSLTKLREHHAKAHGIHDLGVQFGLRQYTCKYCPDIREFDGLHALKDHYSKYHPASSIRKMVKRSRSLNTSTESEVVEISKTQPSLFDQIKIAESSCDTKKQDMLHCILQSQKEMGKVAAKSPTNNEEVSTRSRVSRINSAPGDMYDRPPSVQQIPITPDVQRSFKTFDTSPPTPLIPPATLENFDPRAPLSDRFIPPNLTNLESIYNLSLAELQYLQQCYIYQAFCMNLYYSDPIYRKYVHEKQLTDSLKKESYPSAAPEPIRPSPRIPETARIPDPARIPEPGSSSTLQRVGLKLTQPKLTKSPMKSPRSHNGCSRASAAPQSCFVNGCSFKSHRMSEIKKHVTRDHKIVPDSLMCESKPPKGKRSPKCGLDIMSPHKDRINEMRTHKCTHCHEVLSSFDEYVQHLIEAHRSELGIVSEGSLPNTFNSHFTPPTYAESCSPKQLNLLANKPKFSLTSPKLSSGTLSSPCDSMTSPSNQQTTSPNKSLKTPEKMNVPKVISTPSSSSDQSVEGYEHCSSCHFVGPNAEALKNHEIVHQSSFHNQ